MGRIDIQVDSSTWIAVREFVTKKLNECRQRNDGALSADETAVLRGQIAAWKTLLALETVPESHTPGFGEDDAAAKRPQTGSFDRDD